MKENLSIKEAGLRSIDIVRVMLVKDSNSSYRIKAIRNSESVVSVVKKFLANEDREVFIAINLDRSSKINSINVVAIGSASEASIHPREIFKAAILSNATHIVLAHNHPSGNPEPSEEDRQITYRLLQCGDLLGIRVEDHIIIGDDEYSHCMTYTEKNGKKEIMWLRDKIKSDQEAS